MPDVSAAKRLPPPVAPVWSGAVGIDGLSGKNDSPAGGIWHGAERAPANLVGGVVVGRTILDHGLHSDPELGLEVSIKTQDLWMMLPTGPILVGQRVLLDHRFTGAGPLRSNFAGSQRRAGLFSRLLGLHGPMKKAEKVERDIYSTFRFTYAAKRLLPIRWMDGFVAKELVLKIEVPSHRNGDAKKLCLAAGLSSASVVASQQAGPMGVAGQSPKANLALHKPIAMRSVVKPLLRSVALGLRRTRLSSHSVKLQRAALAPWWRPWLRWIGRGLTDWFLVRTSGTVAAEASEPLPRYTRRRVSFARENLERPKRYADRRRVKP